MSDDEARDFRQSWALWLGFRADFEQQKTITKKIEKMSDDEARDSRQNWALWLVFGADLEQ